MVSDFNLAVRIGARELLPCRNDANGYFITIHEIITRDTTFREDEKNLSFSRERVRMG